MFLVLHVLPVLLLFARAAVAARAARADVHIAIQSPNPPRACVLWLRRQCSRKRKAVCWSKKARLSVQSDSAPELEGGGGVFAGATVHAVNMGCPSHRWP